MNTPRNADALNLPLGMCQKYPRGYRLARRRHTQITSMATPMLAQKTRHRVGLCKATKTAQALGSWNPGKLAFWRAVECII